MGLLDKDQEDLNCQCKQRERVCNCVDRTSGQEGCLCVDRASCRCNVKEEWENENLECGNHGDVMPRKRDKDKKKKKEESTWRADCECDSRSFECFCQSRIGYGNSPNKSATKENCNCDGTCKDSSKEAKCKEDLNIIAEALRELLIKTDNIERTVNKIQSLKE